MVNNIKDNTISEIDAKKTFKYIKQNKNFRKLIPGQKELLNLFNDLSDIILTDKTLMSSKDENEKLKEEKENVKLKEENENENEDDDAMMKILIHSNEYVEETNQNKKIK